MFPISWRHSYGKPYRPSHPSDRFSTCKSLLPLSISKVTHSHITMRSGSGVTDLVYTPVKQWQKDGRVLTGIQQGSASALHKFTIETLNAGTNVAAGVRYVLESADYYLGGYGTKTSAADDQPQNPTEGMQLAVSSMSRELGNAAHRYTPPPHTHAHTLTHTLPMY